MTGAALEASELCVRRLGRTIFRDVCVSLSPGALLQVTGPNGAGKSSLLRVLSSLLLPATGWLTWRGQPLRGGDADYLSQLAYIGHADGIDTDLDATENLRFAARMGGWRMQPDSIRHALDSLGLGAVARIPVRALSQGQRRRVSLARLALAPRALWLLDEPLTSLDRDGAERFQSLLAAHLASGGMAVVATHHLLPGHGDMLDLGKPS